MPLLFLLLLFLSAASVVQAQENWYKVYRGKVSNMDAVFHLHKAGTDYSGYIWFANNEVPMQIFGAYPVAASDSITISTSNGPLSLVLTGLLTDHSFKGNSRLEKEGRSAKQAGFHLQVLNEKQFTSFSYLVAVGKTSLPPAYKNNSQCEYFSSAVWPVNNMSYDHALKLYIRKQLNLKNPAVQTASGMAEEKNRVLANWKKEYSRLSVAEVADMGLSLSYQHDEKILVMHENEQYITLAHYTFIYSGGAHGNYATRVATFSKQTGKQIQLTDLLRAEGIKQLPALLDQVARLQYSIKNTRPLDENGFLVKKILPTPNLYITGTGIVFQYAPYEIKPFSDGEVSLSIPFAAMKLYLLPGFNK